MGTCPSTISDQLYKKWTNLAVFQRGENGTPSDTITDSIKPLPAGYFDALDHEGFMKHNHPTPLLTFKTMALAMALLFTNAHADEYSDVTQLVRSGKLSDALTKADQYLAGKPKDPQMRFIKGVIQRDSGKTTEAIATFTKLTEEYPELPEPYNNLAVLYAGQSQFDKARSALEMAIRTNPSYATAHENLGDVYAKLASQAYNKALQLDNTNAAVAPKLALIRELFNPNAPKTQRPVTVPGPAASTTVSAAPAAPVALPSASAPVATKPAATGSAQTDSTSSDATAQKDVEAAVKAWASAWSAKDIKSYLGAYSRNFDPPGSVSRNSWEEDRKARILGKASISVKLENLQVSVSGAKATAKFRQEYKASGLAVSSRKTLELVKTGEVWQIVKESTGS
jgi:tetratricopeptide (TPR) repeat protein